MVAAVLHRIQMIGIIEIIAYRPNRLVGLIGRKYQQIIAFAHEHGLFTGCGFQQQDAVGLSRRRGFSRHQGLRDFPVIQNMQLHYVSRSQPADDVCADCYVFVKK